MRKYTRYLAVGGALAGAWTRRRVDRFCVSQSSSPTAAARKADERHDARDTSGDVTDAKQGSCGRAWRGQPVAELCR